VLRKYLASPDATESNKTAALAALSEMQAIQVEKSAQLEREKTASLTAPPSPKPPGRPEPTPTQHAPAAVARTSVPTAATQPGRTGSTRSLTTAATLVGAVGVAAAVTGAYFSYRVASIESELTTADRFSRSRDSSGETAYKMQFVMYGAGAAALATAALLYFNSSSRSSDASVALLPWAGRGTGGSTIQVRF